MDTDTGRRYLSYIAGRYPVMCGSDEFYFMPRVNSPINNIDSLDADKITEDISRIKKILREMTQKNAGDRAVYALLRQSMLTYLMYFEKLRIWEKDPSLYLKICALAGKRTSPRGVIRLLREARENLRDIPEGFLKEGKDMANSLISRFKKSTPYAAAALLQFKTFLANSRPVKTPHIDKDILSRLIRDCYSYRKPIAYIYETAYEEYRKTMEQIKNMTRKLKKHAGLKDISSGHIPHTAGSVLSAYTKETEKLRSFLEEKDVLIIPKGQKIIVRRTPAFMEPVRASASYSAPQPGSTKEPAFFYITKDTTVHSEYIFLSAHETYPGHHLLDSARKTIRNPVLRAVESPLFYEGWASYAEELIMELGYISDPVYELAGLRRRAWRAVRALADTGIPLGRITRAECAGYLLQLGYKKDAIDAQLKHYALTPGYQLCYTMGKYEIKRIRKHFMRRLGIKAFHDMLLYGGELPFRIIEEKMKNMPPQTSLYPHYSGRRAEPD